MNMMNVMPKRTPIIGRTYPYLAIHNHDVHRDDPLLVYFISPGVGVVANTNADVDAYTVGTWLLDLVEEYSRCLWDEINYRIFDRAVELSNKL